MGARKIAAAAAPSVRECSRQKFQIPSLRSDLRLDLDVNPHSMYMMAAMTIEKDKNKYSVELPDTYTSDRGGIRRGDVLTHPELGVDGVQTLYEGLRRGLALNPLGPCLGFRAMSSSGFPTPYIYSSYTECVARVDAFAAGLDCLDLVEKNPDGMILVRRTRMLFVRDDVGSSRS